MTAAARLPLLAGACGAVALAAFAWTAPSWAQKAVAGQPEAAAIMHSISVSPALSLQTTEPTRSSPIAAPLLDHRVEPKTPFAPAAGKAFYRPLTVEQESDVRALLSKRLKFPVMDHREQGPAGAKAGKSTAPPPGAAAAAPAPPPPGGGGPSEALPAAGSPGTVAVFQGAVQIAPAGQPVLTLKAIAAVDSPMRFDPARKTFDGSIQVGFVEIGTDGEQRPLGGHFAFQVQGPVTSDPPIVEPKSTAPPFDVIHVSSDDPGAEVDLVVRSSVNPDGAQLAIPVARPGLEVSISPSRIQGWGLQVADVSVHSTSSSQAAHGASVQLSTNLGLVEPLNVTLDDSGNGAATIRSVSSGTATVTAEGALFGGKSEARVDFARPWSFITAASLGGLAGGILRRGTRWTGGAKRAALELLVAVLCGWVVFGLFALGVNVLSVRLPQQGGEVLAFVVAALGALGGTRLLTQARG